MRSILRKRIACILLMLFQYGFAWSQETLLPYLITSDTTLEYKFTKAQYQILPDKTGELTIEGVRNGENSKKFFTKDKTPVDLDTTVNIVWYRYGVKNNLDKEISVSLYTEVAHSDFYLFRNNQKHIYYKNGWGVAWKDKNGFPEDNLIPLTLAAGEQVVIYNRVKKGFFGAKYNFGVKLLNTDKYVFKRFKETQGDFDLQSLLFAIFAGFCLLGGLFNSFLFIIDRQKIHLFFSLFILNVAFILSPLWSLVVLRYYPHTAPAVSIITGAGLAICFIQFTRYYFQTFLNTPNWDKLLIGLILIQFLPLLILLNIAPVSILNIVMFAAIVISCLGTIIIFSFLKHKTVKPFAIAVLPFGVVLIYFFLTVFLESRGVVLSKIVESISISAFYLAIGWPVLYFTWVLFKQYDWQKREIIQHALEAERLQKEKEIERNTLIEQQKVELEITVQERTAELRQSIEDLQSTQKQLIQSEKMASLGELTAGIAHEIQNPLNFVNNFSEVSNELLDEMNEELIKGDVEEAKAIAVNIKQNLEKIAHHGKRADFIVKGMLQHSRTSTGEKQSTNLNLLADEFLKLSYHGLRAKDKSFNAELVTNFDENLPKIDVVQQDIGRVLLNLFNNAFYAVQERNKEQRTNLPAGRQGIKNNDTTFKPTVEVSSRSYITPSGESTIIILVRDNGNGIPDAIREKIMQPFFTTKPTGEGTGLGLSLSYDIVKAHGGELKVETKEGEGSTFIIQLPMS